MKKTTQFLRFLVVGAINTAIDFGVLNILIVVTGIASGLGYTAFKLVSFLAAMTNSYVLNKRWTFKDNTKLRTTEYGAFAILACVGGAINIGVASLIVNGISVPVWATAHLWANVGAAVAALASLSWNFMSYRWLFSRNKRSVVYNEIE